VEIGSASMMIGQSLGSAELTGAECRAICFQAERWYVFLACLNNRRSRPGYQERLGDSVGSAVKVLSKRGVLVPPGGSAPTVRPPFIIER
jgi:hypothetical protein